MPNLIYTVWAYDTETNTMYCVAGFLCISDAFTYLRHEQDYFNSNYALYAGDYGVTADDYKTWRKSKHYRSPFATTKVNVPL